MVRPLPAGCRLTAIFDSCHSGSALDLPYIYSTEGKIKEPNLLAEAGQGLLGAGMSYLNGDMSCLFKGAMSTFKSVTSGGQASQNAKQTVSRSLSTRTPLQSDVPLTIPLLVRAENLPSRRHRSFLALYLLLSLSLLHPPA